MTRVVIEAFHIDPSPASEPGGAVDPGLRTAAAAASRCTVDRSGQSAHRVALKAAIAAAEIDIGL